MQLGSARCSGVQLLMPRVPFDLLAQATVGASGLQAPLASLRGQIAIVAAAVGPPSQLLLNHTPTSLVNPGRRFGHLQVISRSSTTTTWAPIVDGTVPFPRKASATCGAGRAARGPGGSPGIGPLGRDPSDKGSAHGPHGGPGPQGPQAVEDRGAQDCPLASAAQTLVGNRTIVAKAGRLRVVARS